jgi:hypothetical protein
MNAELIAFFVGLMPVGGFVGIACARSVTPLRSVVSTLFGGFLLAPVFQLLGIHAHAVWSTVLGYTSGILIGALCWRGIVWMRKSISTENTTE